jgi:hypothetical protein
VCVVVGKEELVPEGASDNGRGYVHGQRCFKTLFWKDQGAGDLSSVILHSVDFTQKAYQHRVELKAKKNQGHVFRTRSRIEQGHSKIEQCLIEIITA